MRHSRLSFFMTLVLGTTSFGLNAASFLVENLEDSGAGSFRQAILDANDLAGQDTIDFSGIVLPYDTSPVTIHLLSGLPAIIDSVIMDASITETRILPGDPVKRPGVELDLSAAAPVIGNLSIPFFPNGLSVVGPAASGSEIRGFIINGINRVSPELCFLPFFNPASSEPTTPATEFCSVAISIFGANGIIVAGNYLNTDSEGEELLGRGVTAISLVDTSNTVVGGEKVDDRNILTAKDFEQGDDNDGYNMIILYSLGWGSAAFGIPKRFNDNQILGNLLGVSASGMAMNPFARGIWLRNLNTPDSPVGPLGWGGQCDDQNSDPCEMSGNTIRGNTLTSFGGQGTFVFSGAQTNTDLTDNISYNRGSFGPFELQGKVEIFEGNTGRPNHVLVSNNRFGVDAKDAPSTLPTTFGFTVAGGDNVRVEHNIITGALFDGVAIFDNLVLSGKEPASNITLSQNSIFGNCKLGGELEFSGCQGIDLRDTTQILTTGPTPNDDLDPDSGANNLQNTPMLLEILPGKGATQFVAELDSTPNQVFLVEFFSNSTLNPAGRAEGERFIGRKTVATNRNGHTQFSFNYKSKDAGEFALTGGGKTFVTATATRKHCEPKEPGCLYGSTSEFSPACEWHVNSTEPAECMK